MDRETKATLDKIVDALTHPQTGVYARLTRIEMRLSTVEKILRWVAIISIATAITVLSEAHLVQVVKLIGGLLK